MYIEEIKEVKSTKKVVVSVVCDNCGKENKGDRIPKDWHSYCSQHYEWGNDSFESVENYHVCSAECYIESLKNSFEDLKDYKSAEIGNMNIQFVEKLVNFISK